MHWGTHISHVWFSWWRVDRLLPFMLTLGVMFMLSMVHESLSMVRRRMLVHAMTTTHSRSGSVGIASLVRLLEAGLSGLLILGLMTFNGWIFLSICLGSGIGYYVTLMTARLLGILHLNQHCTINKLNVNDKKRIIIRR